MHLDTRLRKAIIFAIWLFCLAERALGTLFITSPLRFGSVCTSSLHVGSNLKCYTYAYRHAFTYECQSISHGTFPPAQKGWCRECNMWHVCKCYHQMGAGVWECTCISRAEILLVTLFRNGSPCSGTVCEYGNVICPWHKHTGVPCRATKALFDCALPYQSFARWV
jgi:hypothetical protein